VPKVPLCLDRVLFFYFRLLLLVLSHPPVFSSRLTTTLRLWLSQSVVPPMVIFRHHFLPFAEFPRSPSMWHLSGYPYYHRLPVAASLLIGLRGDTSSPSNRDPSTMGDVTACPIVVRPRFLQPKQGWCNSFRVLCLPNPLLSININAPSVWGRCREFFEYGPADLFSLPCLPTAVPPSSDSSGVIPVYYSG